MIPVDLNRLREARDLHRDRGYVILEVSPPLLALVEGAEAVLDAPTVWWCRYDQETHHHPCNTAWPNHSGCGLVALVPVKGKTE